MHRPALRLAALALVSALGSAAYADGRVGIIGGGGVVRGQAGFGVTQSSVGSSFGGVSAVGRPAIGATLPGPPVPTTVIRSPRSSWGVGYGVPLVFGAPPVIYETQPPQQQAAPQPPVAYAPPAPPAAPPAPPGPETVQYADGRYELRGDGLAVPHRWVWIPNAPPPPARAGRPAEDKLYGWVDERGVTHVTDKWEQVPPKYREQAKKNQSS